MQAGRTKSGLPAVIVIGCCCGVAVVRAGSAAVPEPTEVRKLLRAQTDYAALAPDVRARTPRPSSGVPPLSKPEAEQWRQALWSAWVAHVGETRSARQIEVGDPWTAGRGIVTASWWPAPGTNQPLVMRYGTRVFGKKPEGGWPLYINLHAGGTARADNDRCWALTRGQYRIETGLYLCPRALRDLAESWYDPLNYPLLDRVLAEAFALWEVNPDKVYLMGFSMGGWGVMHLAPTLPDRWAAVSASAGAGFVGATGRAAPDNLRNTPILIQVGGNDLAFRRQPLSSAFAAALKAFHERDPEGYEVQFKEHKGQGHQINDGDAPGWLARHTRDPLPRRIVWQQPVPTPGHSKEAIDKLLERDWAQALHYPRQVGWLRNDKPGAWQRVVASRDGNTVTIEEAQHVEELILLLDDRMADLDQPVRVLCGGREIAVATPKRTVDALIASLVARGDPRLMFSAEVAVRPTDTTAAPEGKPLAGAEEYLRRSRHRQARGRFAEALDDLEAAVRLDPARGPAGCFREMLALAVAIRDEPRRAGLIRRWADADKANATLQQQAAEFFLGDGPEGPRDPVTALRFAERAVAADPNSPRQRQVLGFALHANGRSAEAAASIRKAMDLLPAKGAEENRRKLEETLKVFEGAHLRQDKPLAEAIRDTLPRRIEREPFVIHTDLPEPEARHHAKFFEGFYGYFSTNYFPVVQQQKLVVLLFARSADYEAFQYFGRARSPFGYYVTGGENTLVVNVERGLGTATHELVHHFLAVGGIERHANWVSEGIPEFFEKFMGYVADDGTLHISFGYFSNWRFPDAQAKIATCTLPKLFQEFDPNLSSAFMLFLHRDGVMRKFVRELHAKGKDAKPEELLVALYGQPLAVIEREWKAWVAGQPLDEDVNLVPAAFVKTESEWRAWWERNQDRLVWDEKQERYRVRVSKPVPAPAAEGESEK